MGETYQTPIDWDVVGFNTFNTAPAPVVESRFVSFEKKGAEAILTCLDSATERRIES